MEVCLKHPVALDTYSGFYAKKAGYQHLNAKMALAFVRQRHGLINGDLDRTHRQQAFLDSVMQQLRTEGVLSDLGKINSLLSVAKQYVITDSGWDLLDFATQMRSLNSSNLTFHTLPIVSYVTIAGQSANQVDPALIQKLVQKTFYPAPRASGSARPKPSPRPRSARPRPPRPPSTCTTAAAPRGWPARSWTRWSRTGSRPARSATPARCPRPRFSTARARRRAAPRSPGCSASARRRVPRWRPGTSRSCWAGTPRARRHAVRLDLGGPAAHHGGAGRCGQRQERHPLRRLTARGRAAGRLAAAFRLRLPSWARSG